MQTATRFLQVTLSTLAIALVIPATSHAAALVYGTAGSSYTQNFDSLAQPINDMDTDTVWVNGTTIQGWHAVDPDGDPYTTYTATGGNNHSATDRLRSLGNDSDRAFGAQNGDSVQNIHYGLQLENTTGFALNSFTLTYTGEQWRAIGNEGADGLTFSYQIFNSGTGSLTATGWTPVGDLNFTAPRTVGGSTGLDGNEANNRVAGITDTIDGITWADGQELWLRWSDNNPSGSGAPAARRAAMGIDDLSFSAVPEPGSALLIGIGGLLLAMRRRR